ncbi:MULTISPECIES: hypothetical protein [Niallia]|uniref:Lipoprotein n=1 Tax=Niallia taxi TaxID=2499688 RepID=A0A3S3SIG6_9BACI|nr:MULTISPECIES: hypothetical protein [Niallia]MDK8642449.1 hypothetical protein [Niallia taxi]MED4040573.1 hypothetical protein [Niallia taxi]MED4057013.1 hypothetical protein [Niallia taxi]MED4121641.1 hypothetical protein [Niallia taxi]RVT59525.1 hypothetical protein EM808_19725 [Niallia taxi]
MNLKKYAISLILSLLTIITLTACATKEESKTATAAGLLPVGDTYIGIHATNEIIHVDSPSSWTIKDEHKDDTNYNITSVEKTGEKVDKYEVYRLVAEEVYGDIESSFSKREGRNFIIVKDEDTLYFRSIADGNIEGITEKLTNAENKDAIVKKISNYSFKLQ